MRIAIPLGTGHSGGGGGGGGPIVFGVHVAAGSVAGSDVTTSARDTTGDTLLVASIVDGLGAPAPSDSYGNTWVQMGPTESTSFTNKVWYVKNPTVGPGHTFTTNSGAGRLPLIEVVTFSGTDTTQNVDQTNGASATATSIQPGNVTPSLNGEVVIVSGAWDTAATASINGGFTITDQLTLSPGTHYSGALAYLIQTTAAAADPTWSLSGSADALAVIGTFKA